MVKLRGETRFGLFYHLKNEPQMAPRNFVHHVAYLYLAIRSCQLNTQFPILFTIFTQ
jgi:hypothetical protein